MTQQETPAPAVPVETAQKSICDLITELKTAVDRFVAEVEDAELYLDESNPKPAPLMQSVQADVEQAVINIESARDSVFEWY
jgi:hypothetical protein